MDTISAVYYACVCAVLAGAIPASARPWVRYAIGAGVGLIAATILPVLRGAVTPALYGG